MADVKWIKITTDIFDDDKILLIESMPDADALIVVWFKLLCLAGKQNNSGVFLMNDRIAYTEEMLATIFRRPLNTVRLALDTFESFGMIDRLDGVITIPNWEKHQSIDQLEKIKEQTRNRVARHREKQKEITCNVTSNATVTDGNATDKIRIDKNREEEKRIDKNTKEAKPPVVYYPNDSILNDAFADYVKMRKQIKAPMTDKAIELAIKKLNTLSGGDNEKAVAILEQSIMNSWKGLFELTKPQGKQTERNVVDEWLNA